MVRIDAASGAVRAVIPVGPDPLLLTSASARIWTLNLDDGTLSRVDPSSNRAKTVRPGKAVGFASDGDDLWVAVGSRSLVRADGEHGRVTASLRLGARRLFAPRDAGFVAATREAVWLTVPKLGRPDEPQTLFRVDPDSGDILARIPLPPNPLTPLAAAGSVWLVSVSDDSLTRIDTRSNESLTVPVGATPVALAAGAKSIWVGHEGEQEVWRLDPATAKVEAKIPIDDGVRGVAFGGGSLWVTTATGLRSVDPGTNTVTRRVNLARPSADEGPIGVAYLDGAVWVSVE